MRDQHSPDRPPLPVRRRPWSRSPADAPPVFPSQATARPLQRLCSLPLTLASCSPDLRPVLRECRYLFNRRTLGVDFAHRLTPGAVSRVWASSKAM
ncbi:hypothetical protein J5N97_020308 [Dioscorea zingiberensis]|uniref:Uncharacterized protein n=1 Tax=Dioscorea zingiberensis TaxID=325984 RepID=A0A9D5HDB2_9LILI|nr:hypothetical protein J5N97_020308 [Dioscorea zingiberensis]